MVDADTVAALAADVEIAGVFIFRASSSGLVAAGTVLTLLPGLGSRLMTGIAELETVGRGAASRLLRVVVVVVELVEGAGWVEVVAGGGTGFSGSGAGVSRTFWILLMAALFSSSRSFTVIV